MKKIVVAFDVDGTLIRNDSEALQYGKPVANERIRTLLITLSSFKNVTIAVWSGGGAGYAQHVCHQIGITKYVDFYASKNHQIEISTPTSQVFLPDIKPHIAIDDIQSCDLGELNLIVREK